MVKREKQFIIGGSIFLVSAILYFFSFKGNLFLPSVFLGAGLFALLFPWINFNIGKKRILKIILILFLARAISFIPFNGGSYSVNPETFIRVRFFETLNTILISLLFSWIAFVLFKYIHPLKRNNFIKVISFIFLLLASYGFYKFVPVILFGVIFGFD